MEKLGWIPEGRDKVEKLSNVLAFFGVASVEALDQKAPKTEPLACGAHRRERPVVVEIGLVPIFELGQW